MQKGMETQAGMTGLDIESRTAFLQHVTEDLRMDIAEPGNQLNTAKKGQQSNAHLRHLIDHVYPDGTCAKFRKQAAVTAGHAALVWAKAKHTKYHRKFAADQYTLIPFALDQFGAACEEAHGLIHALATRQSQRSGGVWPVSQCIARWRQRTSVALQRAVSESVDRTLSRTRQPAVPGGPAPRPWLYREVRLLVP